MTLTEPASVRQDISRHESIRSSETLGPDSNERSIDGYRFAAVHGSHLSVLVGADLLEQVGDARAGILLAERARSFPTATSRRFSPIGSRKAWRQRDFVPTLITIPAGEKSKTLQQAGAICDQMIAAGLDRQSFVVGLGGGMIGDISGFVAAIYHRGIPHVQIPTTLLAMVDSSIGGKTGVDTRDGKNLIGAFHQPSLVIDDLDVLKTLPRRQFNQGFAEIIKHAIIADAKMFRMLKVARAPACTGQARRLRYNRLIKRNIQIKSRIVAKDERDRTGERALLNFGHTVGHAIERAGNYRKFLHGEAVSLGIVAACAISVKRAGLPADQRAAIVDLLERFELPTRLPPKFPRKKILDAVKLRQKIRKRKNQVRRHATHRRCLCRR